MSENLYVYGIVRSNEPLSIQSPGIDAAATQVATIRDGELVAIVSAAPSGVCESNRRSMMAHTRILEEVMRSHTVLPLRFGTIAPDVDAVRERILRPRAAELATLLDSLHGKIEVGLKAIWIEAPVYQLVVERNPAIRELRDRLVGRPASEGHYERIQLGELTEQALTRLRSVDCDHILQALRPLADQIELLANYAERMVVNAAFLIDRQREAEFDAAILRLDAEIGARMLFKYVPAPPYNFVRLALEWGA